MLIQIQRFRSSQVIQIYPPFFRLYPSLSTVTDSGDPFRTSYLSLGVYIHIYTYCTDFFRIGGTMGNVNGREEGCANGGGGDESPGIPVHAPNDRVDSVDLMLSSPPHDHRQSRSPLLFSSQAPVDPLQRDNAPSVNPSWQNGSQRAVDHPFEQGMPIVISWSFGGNNVSVEGSWDNWRSRKILQRSGKDHSILLVLPPGIHCYRFIVDGEVKYAPDLPCDADEMGSHCNLLDVIDYVPENLDIVAEFEAPPSPDSSYSQAFPGDEDFDKDPMLVPPQLQSTVLGFENCKDTTSSSKPQHVELNHLFVEKGRSFQSVVALGLTHWFQSKCEVENG